MAPLKDLKSDHITSLKCFSVSLGLTQAAQLAGMWNIRSKASFTAERQAAVGVESDDGRTTWWQNQVQPGGSDLQAVSVPGRPDSITGRETGKFFLW